VQNTFVSLWLDAGINRCCGAAQKPAFSSKESASLPLNPPVCASLNGVLAALARGAGAALLPRSTSLQTGTLPGVPLAEPCCRVKPPGASPTRAVAVPPLEKHRRGSRWSFQKIPWSRNAKPSSRTEYCTSVLCAFPILMGKCSTG